MVITVVRVASQTNTSSAIGIDSFKDFCGASETGLATRNIVGVRVGLSRAVGYTVLRFLIDEEIWTTRAN